MDDSDDEPEWLTSECKRRIVWFFVNFKERLCFTSTRIRFPFKLKSLSAAIEAFALLESSMCWKKKIVVFLALISKRKTNHEGKIFDNVAFENFAVFLEKFGQRSRINGRGNISNVKFRRHNSIVVDCFSRNWSICFRFTSFCFFRRFTKLSFYFLSSLEQAIDQSVWKAFVRRAMKSSSWTSSWWKYFNRGKFLFKTIFFSCKFVGFLFGKYFSTVHKSDIYERDFVWP